MLIDTSLLSPDGGYAERSLSALDIHQTYCGLDCCLTTEILGELERLFPQPSLIYDFERSLQGPYLEIMQRGFRVDQNSRRHAAQDLREKILQLKQMLDEFAMAVWGKPLNANSPAQLKAFLYDAWHLPEQWLNQKGERKLSTNREALEALDVYLYARPFTNTILAIRDLSKQLSVFETEIDADGRFRAAYNIAGTETGRPSSSQNAFGTGGNAQNISPPLRYVFVADPGMKMCVIDLEQVEARDVGFFCGCLFDDWSFLDSCESGDLHTNNSMLIWPELPWTGDKKTNRQIAERNFYREFSYRDMAKRGGHLSNYYGTAYTASRALKVPVEILDEFQARYCRGRIANPSRGIAAIDPAYPCIPRWWDWTALQLQSNQCITTPFGRQRHFFGRPDDATTLREAIAFLPQSTTADRMNLGLWRTWRNERRVQLLAQTYDSITFQYPETADETGIIENVLKLIRVELRSPSGRLYVVPGEAKVGWNWGAEVTEDDQAKARSRGRKAPRLNIGGLIKWTGKDLRKRPTLLDFSFA